MFYRLSCMKPVLVPPREGTLLYNIHWDKMERSWFGSDLGKCFWMVWELCNNVLDMIGDSLCDIQMDRSDGLIMEQYNGFARSNDQDKPVHN